ncbi:hypothetical protein [Pseudomonas asiatica]|uniref:DUF1640 domain-containing protein n=1 Tax=Pseudomonas asiatica TaxID=2219225 RepID=A0AAJ5LIS6_9PSED|nr:hypothetical protein [Pseudomonas asiatica]UUC20771.1 hypothetical protein NOV18_09940 [Pseudomonas asiatica]WPX87696.1 hypothetical protein PsasTeo6_15240 [Pseudomonas asiatica]
MGNVVPGKWGDSSGGAGHTGGSGGGSDLESRVAALEKAIPDIRERLARVETKLDTIEKTMATKSDLEAVRHSIATDVQKTVADATWRFVQISVVLAGLAFTAAKFIG